MKTIIVIALTLLMSSTFAMPSYLKDGKVTVTLKNGKVYTYSTNDMAVVERSKVEVKLHSKVPLKHVKKESINKNRVYGMAGSGPTNKLDRAKSGDINSMSPDEGFVGGFGYMREIDEDLNIGIQLQTNGTTTFTFGFDF